MSLGNVAQKPQLTRWTFHVGGQPEVDKFNQMAGISRMSSAALRVSRYLQPGILRALHSGCEQGPPGARPVLTSVGTGSSRALASLGLDTSSFSVSSQNRELKVAARARGRQSSRSGESTSDGDDANGAVVVKVGDSNGVALEMDTSRVIPVELHKEASESYVAYAMSVIVGRALPDARDGLKPVHRRILFAMHELGLASKKPFRKCARVVGEVLGKYHPHGDTAVYDALVRMAQDFSLRSPLVDGHGNFGSVDADPPAAMRYTECKLRPLAEAMLLADIEDNTVDFIENFDGSQKEPVVLPSRLPNLLINGSQGIAVGMATSIPPHNLSEVVDALCALVHNPNASIEELAEYLPGPDFPTGGQILGSDGILSAYRTGSGSIVLRGKAHIEQNAKSNRAWIIITEIPYQTNKAALVEKIADLVNNKVLEGVSDVRDESDRTGMRVVIEVKRGATPMVVLNNLYRHTNLQSRFSCNMVGLVNGEPQLMNLRDFFQTFLDFRCNLVQRRAQHQLEKAEQRDHLVQGLIVALENMGGVVATIREARDTQSASKELQARFALSEAQAAGVLEMPLRRLTGLERGKLEEEHKLLSTRIADLKDILASRRRVLDVVEKEARALQKQYGTPRRTQLERGQDGEVSDQDVIANEECILALSEKGYVKRMLPSQFKTRNRRTRGMAGAKMRTNDTLSKLVSCKTHDKVLFFSERGIVYSIRAFEIPESSRIAAGSPLLQLLSLPPGEKVTSILPLSSFPEDEYLVMLTTKGAVKKTPLSHFESIRSKGIVAMPLDVGDELRWVRKASSDDDIVIASQCGQGIRFGLSDKNLRASSRIARGVIAMRGIEDSRVAAMDIIPKHKLEQEESDDDESPLGLLVVTRQGFGKRLKADNIRSQGRGGRGSKIMNIRDSDEVSALHAVGQPERQEDGSEEEVIIGSEKGVLNRIRLRDISLQSRTASGVHLMRLDEGDAIRAVSVVLSSQIEEEDGVEGDSESLPNDGVSAALAAQ